MTNQEIASRFYQAFQKKDATGMIACYADDIRFSDPVFPDLKGQAAKDMWRMLCQSKDLRIEFSVMEAGSRSHNQVMVRWDAWYTFSKTKRPVHNIVFATLTLEKDKIVRHVDHFDFWRWARQAIGPAGALLGWTPMMRDIIRRNAAESLAKFQNQKEHI